MTPVTNIQKLYQQYAFLDEKGHNFQAKQDVEATPVDNVSNIWNTIVKRSYEKPNEWYLVVFSPINKAYAKDPDFFKVKGLDHCRKMFKKPSAYILTREIHNCEKIHVNALVCTDQDLMKRNTTIYCNKYYVHVQHLALPIDRDRVLTYITKEKTKRTYLKYLDYVHYTRS